MAVVESTNRLATKECGRTAARGGACYTRVAQLVALTTAVPYTTVCITRSIARQPRGRQCQYRTVRLRKAFGETFLTPTFLATALLQLWIYRAWKIGPGGYDNSPSVYG